MYQHSYLIILFFSESLLKLRKRKARLFHIRLAFILICFTTATLYVKLYCASSFKAMFKPGMHLFSIDCSIDLNALYSYCYNFEYLLSVFENRFLNIYAGLDYCHYKLHIVSVLSPALQQLSFFLFF